MDKSIVFACVGIICAHETAAQNGPPAADPLQEVVVTATRVAQPAVNALEPVIVIDRATLEDANALDIGDVLRYHAGLDIGRSGGPGQPLSLFIRGANSDQSIVMIDGVRINAGTIGLAPLANLTPELFERIEIVEGPRSAIYGTDAIGGVVNLITRHGGPSGADLMLDYGRYATGEAAVDGGLSAGDSSVRAAFTGQRSDGFPPIAGDTLDSGYKNLSGTAAADTRIGAVELGAWYWQSTGTTDYVNGNYNLAGTAFASFTPLSERFENSALAAHAGADLTDIWHSRLTVSHIVDDLRQEQVDVYNVLPVGDFDHTARATLDWQNDVKIAGPVAQRVTFGTILTREHTNSLSFGTPYAIETDTETYYLQDQLESGAHRVLIAGGYYHHPSFGAHETWNAEYGYALDAQTLLIASAGTAFRAPSATDRFGYGGNPNLRPESSRNVEIGLKWHLGATQLVTFSAFQDSIDELIFTVYNPVSFNALNENIDRARIRGLQASWEYHSDPWSVHADASVQDPRNLSADAPDSQLPRRTKHSFTVGAARHVDGCGAAGGSCELGIDALESGAREDLDVVSGGPTRDGGYLLAAVHAKYTLNAAWSITARLDNALDRRYQTANGYNSARRSASISTRFSFR